MLRGACRAAATPGRCRGGRRRRALACWRAAALVAAGCGVRGYAASARAQALPCSNSSPAPAAHLGSLLVAGVDEAGRGTLAGPVVAAAVAVAPSARGLEEGVVDSKRLSKRNRELVYQRLVTNAGVRWCVCVVGPDRIDNINILQATFEAMAGAVDGLRRQPVEIGEVLIDGNQVPPQLAGLQCSSLIRGDQLSFPVAAASILAKVTRDRLMLDLDGLHPQYGFRQHQGYGTKAHLEALRQHGPCPAHRMSFNPIRRFQEMGSWDPP